ncbi:crossover junction endodeoxyribonuclease RuvC [Candidatus Palauibacter sp.]|uniref:crossover junction endodeoxyribonuclease RuvC n=1 Tax=Candidatus Palauibacter sp. TaxID=3101350 RepID=UPI003B02860C
MLGIDPGTRATGYGCIEGGRSVPGLSYRLIECGVVRPRGTDLGSRLEDIHCGTLEIIDRLAPTCVAIESAFHGRNARTAMVLGHARGVLVLAAQLRGLPIHEYAPRQVKKRVVGTGAASKEQVGFMVKHHLRLGEAPRPADAADGCAVALCHLIGGGLP